VKIRASAFILLYSTFSHLNQTQTFIQRK